MSVLFDKLERVRDGYYTWKLGCIYAHCKSEQNPFLVNSNVHDVHDNVAEKWSASVSRKESEHVCETVETMQKREIPLIETVVWDPDQASLSNDGEARNQNRWVACGKVNLHHVDAETYKQKSKYICSDLVSSMLSCKIRLLDNKDVSLAHAYQKTCRSISLLYLGPNKEYLHDSGPPCTERTPCSSSEA